MTLSLNKTPAIIGLIIALCFLANAQDLVREFAAGPGSVVQITNKYGRVAVIAIAATAAADKPPASKFKAAAAKGVAPNEIKFSAAGGRTIIVADPQDKQKRIDITVTLPERVILKIETLGGAVDISGDLASAEVVTDTGTISTDVPLDDLKYEFIWTQSRPRLLADIEIEEAKEKSGGRFAISGKSKVQSPKPRVKLPNVGDELPETKDKKPRANDQKPKTVSLNFTTARGIILLNVPQNEVMSDLRERPLTEAAKAIIRSGDSLLMEAIRRASPKYFGDYSRTLPPVTMEPRFAAKTKREENPDAAVKTAVVRVTDLKNRAIDGLTANDFEVIENGTAREIVSVTRSTAPFNLVLLLDVSGSVENYVNFIRKAARSFVDTVGTEDRVSITIFNEDVKRLAPFTTDKENLSKSLDTFDAGGGTAYYDALAYTIADTLRPLKGERTAIVILTDGDDNRSFLSFESLMGSIQESGALIYPLYVPSGLIAMSATGADIDPLRKKYMSLTAKSEGEGDRLARVSGGVYYSITQIGDIQKAYDDIVLQLRSAYNIKFRSDIAGGNSPRLKVKAKRENAFATVTSVVAEQ